MFDLFGSGNRTLNRLSLMTALRNLGSFNRFLLQARKESTVEECEKNIGDSLKDRVCELRQYTPVSSDDMDKHMQCVLEVVGFVDGNGEVKVSSFEVHIFERK